MKGNHNKEIELNISRFVVINMSKIQNERKSQQDIIKTIYKGSCN